MRKIIQVLFPLLLVSCLYIKRPDSKNNGLRYIENEGFLASVFSEYSLRNIALNHKNILWAKTPYINLYDSSIVDTIYRYESRQNLIEVYKSVDRDFLISYKSSDSTFILPNHIQPGISKSTFMKNLNINQSINDTVEIGNIEGNMYFTFCFDKGKLTLIDLKPYFD